MNTHIAHLALALGLALGLAGTVGATSFTYHGQLQDAGQAANGSYDLELTLYSARDGGQVLAGPVTLHGVPVKDGNFSTTADFGPLAPLAGQGWVGVRVRAAGSDFVALDTRSPVTPEASACPGSWTLDGNAGIPNGSYLGTADDNPLFLQAGGAGGAHQGIRIQSNPIAVGINWPEGPLGQRSTAIGAHAQALFAGSIVTGGFNDSTFGDTIRDTATNQVIFAAQHGVGINTAKAADGQPLRDELTIAPSAGLPGDSADIALLTPTANEIGHKGFNIAVSPGGYLALNGLYSFHPAEVDYGQILRIAYYVGQGSHRRGEFRFNGATASGLPLIIGTDTSNGNGAYLSNTGVWSSASSRSFKEAFTEIDTRAILAKLVALPIQSWFYKGNHADGLHIGPVAEDFAAAFGLGSNEKYIGTVDESGIALAAIQGLHRKVEDEAAALRSANAELQAQAATLRSENASLRERLDALATRLERLESARGL